MRKPDFSRRVAVTGLGIVSPVGSDIPTAWANLTAGRSGLREITYWDASNQECRAAGEVHDFDPNAWMDFKAVRRTDKNVVFGVAAAKQAATDAGLVIDESNADEVGVVFGSGVGGPGLMADAIETMKTRPRSVSPFFIANMLPDTASGQIAIELGARGPNMCIVTACSTGTHNIGEAAEGIRRGDFHTVITGSTEAPLFEVGYVGFSNMRGMGMPRPGESLQTVSRPFDLTRDGFVIGAGAGIMILEELEHAKARKAPIYAELTGYGSTADAYRMTDPHPQGRGAVRAIADALADAGLRPTDVGYINAHGTSTQANDSAETAAIKAVFKEHAYKVPVSSSKSMLGHLIAAAGVAELVICVMALRKGVLPPTINYETPDPACDLDYIPNTAREVRVDHVLSNSFGFGGQNISLTVSRFRD